MRMSRFETGDMSLNCRDHACKLELVGIKGSGHSAKMTSRLGQMPERLVAKLWKERAWREGSLRASNGRRFRIIYPGRVGTNAGPDFRDAVFEEEGIGLVRGDVEVHVRQRDWEVHGHGRDPRYNGVALHVVAGITTASTTLHSGNLVPVLSLQPLLGIRPPPSRCPDPWRLLRPHGYAPPHTAAELGVLLDRAGDSRFLAKSDAFLAALEEEAPEQVLYQGLMEALGYSQNRASFLELANRVPYALLKGLALAVHPRDRSGLVEETLLGAAGFEPLPTGTARLLHGISGGRIRPMGQERWNLFRVRPQNHPRRRIIGFTRLIDLLLPRREASHPIPLATVAAKPRGQDKRGIPIWTGRGLVRGMVSLVEASSAKGTGDIHRHALEEGIAGLRAPTAVADFVAGSRGDSSHIGIGRARDMAVNCVLPFAHALSRLERDGRLGRLSLGVYHEHPKLQENELTREMARQLFGRLARDGPGVEDQYTLEFGRVVTNARRQQGLIHLYHLMTNPRAPSSVVAAGNDGGSVNKDR